MRDSMNAFYADADVLTSAWMAAGMTSRARRRSTDNRLGFVELSLS
ncbi:hypothetical protein [Lysobacter sp. N42]|jgi:hypothetical protein|nr:hypothetical protein [Lysobacter sp. N42]